jgi:hypothetical protein
MLLNKDDMACCRTRNDMAMYSLTHAITILTCRLDRLVSVCSGALPTCRVYNLVRRCMYPCANTLHTAHILSYTYTTYGMVLNPCTHHVLNQCPQKNKHPHRIYKETRKSEMESKTPAPPPTKINPALCFTFHGYRILQSFLAAVAKAVLVLSLSSYIQPLLPLPCPHV